MSKKIYCIVLLLIGNLLYSCGLNSIEYKDEFEASKIAWLNFKESSNNTYTYTVANSSWVGVSWETNISVKNGVVVQRSFEITGTEGLPADFPEHELQWNETENEIDTHDNGAEPITLDEIYTKAQQHWLVRRKNTFTTFRAENDGMISTCGYGEKQCSDDCFRGVNIIRIQ